ncbi:MAG: translocation/assembly module TamB domain-containing protein, partial [Limnobacter sp.]|nr:translocation/assembly module TamB domain-containing protein [Limnobacter sp.]
RGTEVQIDQLDLSDRGATVDVQGLLNLQGPGQSDLALKVQNLDPSRFHSSPYLQGLLNGNATWKGSFGPEGALGQFDPEGILALDLQNSRLAGTPLNLSAKAKGSLSRVQDFNFNLQTLRNTLQANGAYGLPGDSFAVDLQAVNLSALGEALGLRLAGEATVKGKVTGTGQDVAAQLNLDIRQVVLDQWLEVDAVRGDVSLGRAANARWDGQLEMSGLRAPGQTEQWVKNLVMSLEGTRIDHQLTVRAESDRKPFSRRRSLQGNAVFKGGLFDLSGQSVTPRWQGEISALNLEGMWRPVRSFQLRQPASLKVGSESVELSQLVLVGEDQTEIQSQTLMASSKSLVLEGQAPRFALPRLSSVLKTQMTLETDQLVTALNWRIKSSPKQLDGHFDLKYLSGGFSILEDAEIEVPVRAMELAVDFSRERMSAELNLDATQVGTIGAQLSVPVQKSPSTGQWGPDGDAPIEGYLAAGLTDLSWLGPLIAPSLRTQGDGQISLAIAGTLDKPDLQGRLFARQFNVTELDQGVRLEDGEVVVDFNNDRAKLEQFDFTVYHRQAPARRLEELGPLIQGSGKLTANGQWNLAGIGGQIDLKLDRVPLLQNPERWLVASADLSVKQPVQDDQPILIRGEVLAHGAYIELPESQPQTLGSDVVIRGEGTDPVQGSPVDVLVQAKLGDLFFFNAEGLRARLAGGLRLLVQEGVTTPDGRSGRRLQATGTIQTAEGTYRAYGQDLTIERGVVNFQGPLNNPGLNIRAVRKGVAVEAGVEITGSANRPQVTLVSDPPVPDSEKLSWMIIGRGSNSSDRDTTLLLTAAAAIFGDSSDDSTTEKVAKSLGIDDFALSSGSLTAADSRAVGSQVSISPGADPSATVLGDEDALLTQRLITLGKRLSQKLYLSFEQSVTTSANIIKVTYQVNRRLSLIARGGADNAVDALYQFSFD